ncbi:hypothetical protein UFOVP972_123 [uncultured Caudovirales phage]|uniref:Uncharacterized protein n=1 Tax=uncultured Caudovirales phage TaxID=2100421 RepID=A0A6J5PWT1_9CAUD|nr:hypothetical protein UFOVP972_123 [uncultured Caudovirales phage]
MTKEEFKAGVLFLLSVKNDYQFDPDSPDHCGFLACDQEITDDPGFMIVANNPEEFELILEGLGLGTEEGIHVETTVFILI